MQKAIGLIGYPLAGESWNWTGHLVQFEAERKAGAGAGGGVQSWEDWAARVSLQVGDTSGGDITGRGVGKLKRARAVGAGVEPEYKRAADLEAWASASEIAKLGETIAPMGTDVALMPAMLWQVLMDIEAEVREQRARRSAILAGIVTEQSEGKRLLSLAGGHEWGDGRRYVFLNSSGMAARAARCIKNRRGVTPSDTSLQDAAAAAAASMSFQWAVYSSLVGELWNDTTVRHLAAYGWRAAFRSLTSDQSDGMTGDRAGQHSSKAGKEHNGGESVALDAAQLQVESASLKAWANDRQGRVFDAGADTEAQDKAQRRATLRWIASVLDTKAKGRTGAAERARFSLLARLIHGRDIATAARGAGFASGGAAVESLRAGGVWARLRVAIGQRVSSRDKRLLAVRARAVAAAVVAIKAQRRARGGAGRSALPSSVARLVSLCVGASSLVYSSSIKSEPLAAMVGAVKVTRPAARRVVVTGGRSGRGGVHSLARVWSEATTARGQAVAVARAARSELLRARASRLADFDAGTRLLRSGNLARNEGKTAAAARRKLARLAARGVV